MYKHPGFSLEVYVYNLGCSTCFLGPIHPPHLTFLHRHKMVLSVPTTNKPRLPDICCLLLRFQVHYNQPAIGHRPMPASGDHLAPCFSSVLDMVCEKYSITVWRASDGIGSRFGGLQEMLDIYKSEGTPA